jgi:hypothetical protein
MTTRRKLGENLKRVKRRMAEACIRAGRDPADVRLVAVTKFAPSSLIRTLVELGQHDLGESRPQALVQRAADLAGPPEAAADRRASVPRWHLVGHLQRNKVKSVLPFVDLIHSVDTLRLGEDIDAHSANLGRCTPVLLEVNASEDPKKHGCAVAAATHLAEQLSTLKHLELRGLMAMAPLTDDVDRIRRTFARTRELFDEVVSLGAAGPACNEISMGMSGDFEIAIEFGATFVRIGSALFEGIALPAETVSAEESSG